MSHFNHQQFTFVIEIVMITHLTGEEGISSLRDSLGEEKTARTTTQRHTMYSTSAQSVVAYALYTEQLFQATKEDTFIYHFSQLTYDPCSCRRTRKLGLEKCEVGKAYFLCYTVVHSPLSIVQIGMSGIDTYPLLYSLDDATLHITLAGDRLESVKQ